MVSTVPETASREVEPFQEKFARVLAAQAGREPGWLESIRQAGMTRFAALGFPGLQHEDWRFTSLAPLAKLHCKPVLERSPADDARAGLETYPFAPVPGCQLVFVNGHFAPPLSRLDSLPAGVQVTSLAAVLAAEPARLERHLTRYAATDDNPFAALNEAFFQDGAFLHVPAGVEVAEPVQLIFVTTAKESGATIQPRNLFLVESGARLTVLESYLAAGDGRYFTNAVTECLVGDDATVEHLKFQDESVAAFHIATLQSRLGRDCRFQQHSFALGARLSRNNIRTTLAAEGLECVLNGLYLTKGEQLADHHMVVEHARPHGASHEYFNGILDDRSKGVFHGRILVRPEAQKTDAKQTNKNLLLSDEATVDTKPQLEIYADDVRCTHGATVGQMNPDAIFYLRARGVGLPTARRMLMHAFAGEIIDRVLCEAARETLDRLVWDRLEQNPHIAASA
jgi:Fe-S cluster assembly protein SufD